MFKTLYPTKDTTLYSRHPDRNTGVDQILELTKVTSGSAVDDLVGNYEFWDTTFLSRMLLDFDLSGVSQSISSGDISNAKFYLAVKATEAIHLPISYTLYAHPVSGSWTNGTGYYNNDAEVTNGASWRYRHGKSAATQWSSSGGDYYPQYTATQLFNYEFPDIRINVTNIVNAWISGSIPQYGFILKHSNAVETDGSEVGSIKFFSKDTHTVYIPRLQVYWDNADVSGTGSVAEITGDEYVIYAKNLKESYFEQEVAKIRLGVRQRFPTASYANSGVLTTRRMPFDSFFQVMDSRTDEVIIEYDDPGTRVSCDAGGNYIRVDMNSFLPERFYKIVFRIETDGGDSVNYIDDGMWFKVVRK